MKTKPKGASYGHHQLPSIKLLAREIKKNTGVKHCIALSMSAKRYGFQSYAQARAAASPTGPFPGFVHKIFMDNARGFQSTSILRRLVTAIKRTSRMTRRLMEKSHGSIPD
ncbi:hypothetical protein MBA34_13140 [Pseudomonas capeferrum]|uniref:hypothetical protein n=1 Tax=Pseudomonas capeferrum TaxID=1495066 RepID=UPI0012DF3505|nr:hypothetical protein [Pseudomonas capeferrum]MCH7299984.1 hypothetical protein [Pseudomonas capeferrum]